MFEQVKKLTIKLQICESRKILLNNNDRLVERYTKFKKDLYYKCILKLQKLLMIAVHRTKQKFALFV